MAFPLDIRTELNIAGNWSDISSDVYLRDVKRIVRGMRDQGSTADPTSLQLTINNRSGKYSRRNAMSSLYGLIGRNTPIRLSVPAAGDHYLQLDGADGSTVSTPDVAALDITGDIDVRAEISPNWYGYERQMIIGKWDAANEQRSWMIEIFDGLMYFRHSNDGTSPNTRFYFSTLPTLPERAAVRATLDSDNGAGGTTCKLYWAPSLDGPWTQFGDVTVAGTRGILAGSAPLRVGLTDATITRTRLPMNGRGYRYEVRNGINGTVVASPDFRAAPDRATSLTDAQGRVWTVAGHAEIRGREDRFVGEVSEWPAEWSTDDADAWTSIVANGPMRRLGQGRKALDSTLRRRIPMGNPLAYWPCEEQREAAFAYSPIPGVRPARTLGLTFGADDSLVSSAPLPTLGKVGTFSGVVPAGFGSTGQWQAEFVYNANGIIPPSGGSEAPIMSYQTTGLVQIWDITMKQGLARVRGRDWTGSDVVNVTIGIGDDVFAEWTRLRFYVSDNGNGTFAWQIAWKDVDGDAGVYNSTVTGSPGRITRAISRWGTLTEGWSFGHMAIFDTAPNGTMDGSDNAFNGEGHWTRMRRLSQEEVLPLTRIAGPLDETPVGYQRQDTVMNLLEAAAGGDGGMLTEDPRRLALRYRDRSSMYSQLPALTLSYKAPGLGPDIQPVDDDSNVENDVTVTRDGGSSGRAVVVSGPLSVLPPPNGIGTYDTAFTLSLGDDDQAEAVANWRVHLGTFDGARYPQVTVVLHKPGAESLIPAVLGLREGDKLRLTGLPVWASAGDVDLIICGWEETLDMYRWQVTFNCVPAGPWNVGVAADAVLGRADVTEGGSQIAAAATATATELAVRTTSGPVWYTAPSDTPYTLDVAGEAVSLAAGGRLLNTNPFFETDVSGWNAQRSGISWTKEFVHPWATGGSLMVAPDGVSADGGATGQLTPVGSVNPGAVYIVSMWAYSPGGWSNLQPAVDWFSSTGAYISTGFSGSGFAVPAGKWTYLEQTFVAPASASRASVRARHAGTPSQAQTWFAWAVRITQSKPSWAHDGFGRTLTDSWGTSDAGLPWTNTGTAADFDVTSGYGSHTLPATSLPKTSTIAAVHADWDLYCDLTTSVIPTGASLYGAVVARWTSDANLYMAQLDFTTSSGINLSIRKRVSTSETIIGNVATGITHVAGTFVRVRFQGTGTSLRAKAWLATQVEPSAWQVQVTDSAITAIGSIGMRSVSVAGNTNSSPQLRYDNFDLVNPQVFSVLRSTNGVAKAQPAGANVRLAQPSVVAL